MSRSIPDVSAGRLYDSARAAGIPLDSAAWQAWLADPATTRFTYPLHDRRAGAGLSATKHYRDRDVDVSLLGQRCRRCGQVQFPHQRVCYRCRARDEFESVRLSDKVGTVKSFTFDNFAGSPNPPLVAGIVDVEGARLYVQMTDVSPKEVKLDMPVELTFRKIHEAGGAPNYFWKSTPLR